MVGSNSATLSLSGLTFSADHGDKYRVVISATGGATLMPSNVVTLTVQAPVISIQTPPQSVTSSGDSATFSVQASVTGGETLSYQWQRSTDSGTTFTNINGEVESTLSFFSFTTAANGYQYRVVVAATGGATSVTSAAATLSVVPAITITAHPESQSVTGGSVTFSVTANISAGATLSYQWQRSTDSGATFSNLPGKTATTLSVNANNADGYQYRVVVSGSNGAPAVTSNAATLSVGTLIVIDQQPAEVSTSTRNASLSVIASVTTGATPTYSWEKSTDGGTTWSTSHGGTATAALNGNNEYVGTLSLTDAVHGWKFRVVVSATGATSVTSNTVTVSVVPVISITVPPQNQNASNGGASFSVTASNTAGLSMSYQWQRSDDAGASWQNVGTDSATLTLSGLTFLSDDGDLYQVVVSAPQATAVTSSSAQLGVDPPAISISSHPQPVTTTVTTATFSVSASISNGGSLSSYQWEESTDGVNFTSIDGAIASSYTKSNLTISDNGKFFRAIVFGTDGATPVTSDAAVLTLTDQIQITAEPTAQTASNGEASFGVLASTVFNDSISYQWQKSSNGSTWADVGTSVVGQNALSLTGLTYATDNNTQYRVVLVAASNSNVTATSEAALLTVPNPNAPSGGDPDYNDVTLLLHLDGDLTDASPSPRTASLQSTGENNAFISEEAAKFGSQGLRLAPADYTYNGAAIVSNHPSSLPPQFTAEFWVKPDSALSSSGTFMHWGEDYYRYLSLGVSSGSLSVSFNYEYYDYEGYFYISNSFNRSLPGGSLSSEWHHIALVREGDSISLFLDGQKLGASHTISINYSENIDTTGVPSGSFTLGSTITFGSWNDWGYLNNSFPAAMDDIRLTSKARYTGDTYTVPTAAFPNSLQAMPPEISFSPSSRTLTAGTSISPITVTLSAGTIDSCSVSPALPAGLSLNTTTCVITGTPTDGGATSNHTITASNAVGTGTASLSLNVNGLNASNVFYWSGAPANGLIADHTNNTTALLLNFNGADHSTSIIDVSQNPKTVTAYGNARLRTNKSQFGGASAYFDGTSNSDLRLSGGTPFNFGTGDFTLESWIYLTSLNSPSDHQLVACSSDYNGLCFGFHSNGTRLGIARRSVAWDVDGAVSVSANTWYHVAVSRENSTVRVFLDGALVASGTSSQSYSFGNTVHIGSHAGSHYFAGHMDDLRIVKGAAVYTGPFSPPSSQIPNYGTLYNCYSSGQLVSGIDSYGTGLCNSNYYVNGQPGTGAVNGDYYVDGSYVGPVAVISIDTEPTSVTAVSHQGAATFTVGASVTQNATLFYQWQKQEGGIGSFVDIEGATSSSYSVNTPFFSLDHGDKYRVRVGATGGALSVFSQSATLAVTVDLASPALDTNIYGASGSSTIGNFAIYCGSERTCPQARPWI
ncbi:hypothetical protein EBQ90_11300, partial [bacterium]|nr:hypothetical protein [bacterium]